jgi:hypothetical protein
MIRHFGTFRHMPRHTLRLGLFAPTTPHTQPYSEVFTSLLESSGSSPWLCQPHTQHLLDGIRHPSVSRRNTAPFTKPPSPLSQVPTGLTQPTNTSHLLCPWAHTAPGGLLSGYICWGSFTKGHFIAFCLPYHSTIPYSFSCTFTRNTRIFGLRRSFTYSGGLCCPCVLVLWLLVAR